MSEILLNIDKDNDIDFDKRQQFHNFQLENWKKSKTLISKKVKGVIWKAWIEPLNFIKYENNILYLSARSSLVANRAETQYYETIFLQSGTYFEDLKRVKITSEVAIIKNQDSVKEFSGTDDDRSEDTPNMSFVDSVSMRLNSKFTFNNFVVGESNRLPFAASKRICESKSIAYNPLYIHSNVGMGKTHLLNAIAIDLKKNKPNLKIVIMSAERFMYQFIKAIRLKDTLKFKDQFRSIDILMIDDIQFIGGKGSTQEEFFYTFNDLINQGKQIIISSNKSPFELTDLDEKLRSRLGGGLVVDFLPTDYKLRMKILRKKVEILNLKIPDDVLNFLAVKIVNNVRELEGALNRIRANHELTGKLINVENSEELLSDILSTNQKNISINNIQLKVTSFFHLKLSDMSSSKRSISVARPRQIAMYLCKSLTTFSYPEIGKYFGGKDHTTVIHAVKKIETLSANDQNLQRQINDLKKLILTA